MKKKLLLAILFFGPVSALLAQDRLAEINAEIAAFEKAHPMKYVAGQVVQVLTVPDGTVGYLLCPRQDGRCDQFDKFIAVAHPLTPKAGMSKNPYGPGMIGTTPDGHSTFQAAWYTETIKDGVFIGGLGLPVALYDTKLPPEIAKLYAERAPLLEAAKAKQESTPEEKPQTRPVKIVISRISGNSNSGVLLTIELVKGITDPEHSDVAPVIYVPSEVVPKLGDSSEWRHLESGLGHIDGPAVNGQVSGASATVDVYPCKVKGEPYVTNCVADIRDIVPNRNRFRT